MFDVLMAHPDVGSDAVSSDVALLAASPGVHKDLVDIRLSLCNNLCIDSKCSCLIALEVLVLEAVDQCRSPGFELHMTYCVVVPPPPSVLEDWMGTTLY